MNNEIEFFGTNQKDAFISMANNLIKCYNKVANTSMALYNNIGEVWAKESYKEKNVPAFEALIRKLANIIFNVGDPLSVPVLLKNISINKIQGLGHGGQYDGELDHDENVSVNYGKGHFRWDWQAYTLNELELKAVKMYVNGNNSDFATTSFKYKNLLISSKLVKQGVKFPNSDHEGLHNQFSISVFNNDNNTMISFDYYGSTNDYNNGETEIKGEDLLQAFDHFISDGLYSQEDFEIWCGEFGYDSDSRTAERIYKECQKSLAKAQMIIDGDIWGFASELQEIVNS